MRVYMCVILCRCVGACIRNYVGACMCASHALYFTRLVPLNISCAEEILSHSSSSPCKHLDNPLKKGRKATFSDEW